MLQAGEKNLYAGSLAGFAFGVHRAAVAFDDAVHHRQAEAGAFTDLFGGEKWIEDPVKVFARNACTVVADNQIDVGARGQVGNRHVFGRGDDPFA